MDPNASFFFSYLDIYDWAYPKVLALIMQLRDPALILFSSTVAIIVCNLLFPAVFVAMRRYNANKHTLSAMVCIANLMVLIWCSRIPTKMEYNETRWTCLWAGTFATSAGFPLIVDYQAMLKKKKTR